MLFHAFLQVSLALLCFHDHVLVEFTVCYYHLFASGAGMAVLWLARRFWVSNPHFLCRICMFCPCMCECSGFLLQSKDIHLGYRWIDCMCEWLSVCLYVRPVISCHGCQSAPVCLPPSPSHLLCVPDQPYLHLVCNQHGYLTTDSESLICQNVAHVLVLVCLLLSIPVSCYCLTVCCRLCLYLTWTDCWISENLSACCTWPWDCLILCALVWN